MLFALAGLVGTAGIAGGSFLASKRSGESEAIAEVSSLTQAVAQAAVGPNLTSGVIEGDPDAIARLDEVIRTTVLNETTVRVKLWDTDGRIVYSDEPRLIGEVYALEEDELESLRTGEVAAETTLADGPENRFEAEHDMLLEVYFPVEGPDGEVLLYESYFVDSLISQSSARIRAEFVPILLAAVALIEALHLGLAWGLSKRLSRFRADRERLLERAVESSGVERRRIAADLHDGVVQDLVATSYTITAAAQSAEGHDAELAADLRAAADGTLVSLQSLRSLLVEIYPPNLHEQGLELALLDVLAPGDRLGIATKLNVTGDLDRSHESSALVYRVVQESVRNVFRHSEASQVTVDITQEPSATIARILDDGTGFDPANPVVDGHFGLRVLADLTADAGADLVVQSAPGAGTDVRLVVPA